MHVTSRADSGWATLAARVVAYARAQADTSLTAAGEDRLEAVLAELLRVLANWPAGDPPPDVWSTVRRHWGDRPWLRDLLGPLSLWCAGC